ncbi:MAG TPA: hypothetical protein VFB78_19480 [Acidimicrobiales bacterium]|jgi:hypothetical protein|nr:hypothetical protein [Acidimicrobiales bacterium]
MQYERPSISEIGGVRDLTLQAFNKVGQAPDMYTSITAGIVIGSLVNSP